MTLKNVSDEQDNENITKILALSFNEDIDKVNKFFREIIFENSIANITLPFEIKIQKDEEILVQSQGNEVEFNMLVDYVNKIYSERIIKYYGQILQMNNKTVKSKLILVLCLYYNTSDNSTVVVVSLLHKINSLDLLYLSCLMKYTEEIKNKFQSSVQNYLDVYYPNKVHYESIVVNRSVNQVHEYFSNKENVFKILNLNDTHILLNENVEIPLKEGSYISLQNKYSKLLIKFIIEHFQINENKSSIIRVRKECDGEDSKIKYINITLLNLSSVCCHISLESEITLPCDDEFINMLSNYHQLILKNAKNLLEKLSCYSEDE